MVAVCCHGKCGRGGCSADGGLKFTAHDDLVNQPGGKGVAAADAIQNSDVLKRRSDENIAV